MRRSPQPDVTGTHVETRRAEVAQLHPNEYVVIAGGELVDHGLDLFALQARVHEETGRDGFMCFFTGPKPPPKFIGGRQQPLER